VPIAAIGLGSNQGDAVANVQRAIERLREVGKVTAVSRLYRSAPYGVREQPDFINAAVLLDTSLPPRALLQKLQAIEKDLGRRPTYRWGPRVIDADILYYDEARIDEPDLVVPHPGIQQRQFVLAPLADIDSRYADQLRSGYTAESGECTPLMLEERDDLAVRLRRLAKTFDETDLISLRVSDEAGNAIELHRAARGGVEGAQRESPELSDGKRESASVDVIKANLVGIAHLVKPVPAVGAQLEGDRELGYVEALGIRNPVVARGAGRLVSVLVDDGQAVEYGQPLFEIARVP